MMSIKKICFLSVILLMLNGCLHDFIEAQKAGLSKEAYNAAYQRGQFDLSCENIETIILSEKFDAAKRIKIPIKKDFDDFDVFNDSDRKIQIGEDQMRYTIGVKGCGKKITYIVTCDPYGGGCEAETLSEKPETK